MKIVSWFLRWLVGWADLIDGIFLVCTLGFWCPEASYYAEGVWLDYRTAKRKHK